MLVFKQIKIRLLNFNNFIFQTAKTSKYSEGKITKVSNNHDDVLKIIVTSIEQVQSIIKSCDLTQKIAKRFYFFIANFI